ncbi:MAG: serine dehydratase subunit alpha family protein [Lachnospiraceae bacterium]|nr:serine dehydratase subunit alpha family protein [Lachnospiraceae bacterium]
MNTLSKEICDTYIQILNEELVPAMGCTEPIAVAYCAAKAREVLGCLPQKVTVEASGNIIKNVKSVIVPNTEGLKGIPAAAAAGIVAGKVEKILEVISEVTKEQKEEICRYLEEVPIQLLPLEECDKLDIIVSVAAGEERAKVRISRLHSNISYIEKNGEVLYQEGAVETDTASHHADRSTLTVERIIEFADTVDTDLVKDLLQQQVDYNCAIAEEGLANDWGANVGSVLIKCNGDSLRNRAKAMAAAGSDARMSGCELPVMINSGSGNQGITVSVPVAVYAKELGCSKEEMYRALLVSNLIAVHIKTGIGPLSAFCGAVSAGCAAGCGIAYLQGGRLDAIAHTLVNAIAIVSGIVCDGAKPSCAGKIASSIDAAFLGYDMYLNNQQFYGGDGIVSKGVENTIRNIGRLGAQGMCDTDREIIRIMTD